MYAYDHVEIAKYLIEAGADVHARDHHGRTPLLHTYDCNIAQYLINHGADVNAEDNLHQTALIRLTQRHALPFNNLPLAHLLIIHGARFEEFHEREAFQTASSDFSYVDLQSENGFIALYFAARAMLSHQHDDEETQGRYRTILERVFTYTENIDAHTQALMDAHPILDEMLNPGRFVLK